MFLLKSRARIASLSRFGFETPSFGGSGRTLIPALALAWGLTAACGNSPPESGADAGVVAPPSAVPSGAPPGSSMVPEPVPPGGTVTCSGAGVPSEARLLTRVQYDNSVRDVFKGVISGTWSAVFPAENEVMGFGTNAEFHRETPWLAEGHMVAAERVSDEVILQLPNLVACAAEANEDCALAFADEYGRRAFKRALLAEERSALVELYRAGTAQGGFERGVALLVQSLLQSPQFLYRIDTSRAEQPPAGNGYALADLELATRLSYFFWNSIPDDELLLAAEAGELHTKEQIALQAQRLIADPRSQGMLLDFLRQWLGLGRFQSLVRVSAEASAGAYNAEWEESLERFIEFALLGEGGGVEKLFTSPRVFLNAHLAALYGITPPADVPADGYFAVDLPGERSGLLTQPGLMALLAHADQSAPIQRGVFVRDRLLCQPPPDPPPTVNQMPPQVDSSSTTRERFQQHTASEDCASCHRLIDGLGLSLEGFDQLGRYRTTENGIALDLTGEIYAVRDESIAGTYDGPVELSQRLARSSQVEGCIVTQFYRYAMGRVEQEADLCSLSQAQAGFANAGGSFTEMLVAMVQSDAFRFRAEATEGEP